MMVYHQIDILVQSVKKSAKLNGISRINAYYTLAIKPHILLKKHASLHSVGKKLQSLGKLIGASAIRGYTKHSEDIA